MNAVAPIIFSGIQPTGRKHLGNYIGAIRQLVAGQDRGDPAIYCIVDLHATTLPYDPQDLRERVHDTTAILLAAGLDAERCILFRQGDVAEHTYLCWLLTSVTANGELQRMHQFRDKSPSQRELASAGLLLYPVLQAADVLVYRGEEVPVGEDQREHLELMRNVARRFNARFGEDVLVVPEHRIPTVGARVRDLLEPDAQDVDDGRHAAGDGPDPRRAGHDPQEVQARGDRLRRPAAPALRRRQAGGHQPHRDPRGDARHDDRRGRGARWPVHGATAT